MLGCAAQSNKKPFNSWKQTWHPRNFLHCTIRKRQPWSHLMPAFRDLVTSLCRSSLVAYASRSMTVTERRYAQIKKEALATTWAFEHWAEFLIGMRFKVERDQNPLIPLFSTKLIDELPVRIQRFRMRLVRFNFVNAHALANCCLQWTVCLVPPRKATPRCLSHGTTYMTRSSAMWMLY